MSTRSIVGACLGVIVAVGLLLPVHASQSGTRGSREQGESGPDRTVSPYFFVKGGDPEVDRLPLKKTSADVDISGVIAKVKVTQVYENEGERPIEAKYVFPASTRAAVHGLTMSIGERTIVARIDEREKAREDYEEAKQKGKTASLLEQQRPNVFQMNVANIMPGDVIEVDLVYTEMLVPENGEYSFVYPTVVGPRYSEKPSAGAPDAEQWVESPYLHEDEEATYTFDLDAELSTGIPLKKVGCSSHDVRINYQDARTAEISLADDEKHGGNRDFILNYVLAQDQIETGLMLWEGSEENFFAATVQPPKRVDKEMVPPREYIFIVDVSGSMHGFPLGISKKLMRHLLKSLRPKDHFNVVFFAGGSFVLAEQSLPATSKNVKRAVNAMNKQRGGGGTRLLEALKTAYDLPRANENVSRTVVLATDGYVSVEQAAFDIIRENLGNTNVFAFGIGSSVNRYLVRGVAKCGKGEEFVVTKQGEASEAARKFEKYVSSPLLTGIDVAFRGFEAYDVEPPKYPDIFADRPLVITGKYRDGAEGSIHITGYTGEGAYNKTLRVDAAEPSDSHEPLKYAWVRKRIARLSDYVGKKAMKENEKEVTRLGLQYSLLTRYTSFVAVDKRVRRDGEELETVEQPLPLPKGVSDLAVGGRTGRTQKAVSRRPARSVGGGSVPQLDTSLPAPMFAGTPGDLSTPILEPNPGQSRKTIKIPEEASTNVAQGKPVTSKKAPIMGGLEMVTDGDKSGRSGSVVTLGPGTQWVQIDLGQKYEIYGVLVWHYHARPRIYHDVIVQIANDEDFGQGVETIFNNDQNNSSGPGTGSDYEYIEDNEGRWIAADGVEGRYVRLYSNGSTANDLNHYCEVEVYGIPAE